MKNKGNTEAYRYTNTTDNETEFLNLVASKDYFWVRNKQPKEPTNIPVNPTPYCNYHYVHHRFFIRGGLKERVTKGKFNKAPARLAVKKRNPKHFHEENVFYLCKIVDK